MDKLCNLITERDIKAGVENDLPFNHQFSSGVRC